MSSAGSTGGVDVKNVHSSAATSYDNITKTQAAKGKEDLVPYRHFNNFVKKMQVNFGAKNPSGARGARDNGTFSVLDLASGRGGDLGKWLFAHVVPKKEYRGPEPMSTSKLGTYVGVDVSPECILEAQRRIEMMTSEVATEHKRLLNLSFSVGNCFDQPFWESLQIPTDTTSGSSQTTNFGATSSPVDFFDVVSVQFALHYGCDSRDRVKMIVSNIAKVLSPKGAFIATIVDAEVLSKLKTSGKLKNSLYDIHFIDSSQSQSAEKSDDGDGDDSDSSLLLPIGTPYHFHLEGHVDNVEYVIPYSFLRSVCEGAGLREEPQYLNYSFGDMIGTYESDPQAKKQLRGKSLSNDEKELVSIYRSVCFVKP